MRRISFIFGIAFEYPHNKAGLVVCHANVPLVCDLVGDPPHKLDSGIKIEV